jgi:serine/threonine protein kinase/Tfp pilus assembly protein PilF
MIGRTLAQFRIVEELGGGGMGVVFRAEDTKLGRDVALKVLSTDRTADESNTERLLKEARAAAALRHPNICTIYDVGEVDGVWYISMAYLPGRTLKEIVSEGPLPVARAIDIAIQIAQALQSAHDHNVIHRDIKSANVIVDDEGRATILDFGVAKLSGHVTKTREGSFYGTITCVSPEQATGGDVDHRTDIWALGVCLYEMMAGRLPFTGEHDSAVVYQIVNQNPPTLASLGVEAPAVVTRIIDKALEKKPENRYQIVDEMLADLKLARKEIDSGTKATEPSIAVLPFANISADREQDYFCDGMAEEIIGSLAHVEGLRVLARTSSFVFRNTDMDIREIGRKLGVDTVLEGSVQKAGNRLRITAQLINVSDGYHLWSNKYDRDLEDVFAIQDEIARNIVQAFQVTLNEKEKRVIERVPTRDMKAYDFYIRGLHHYYEMDRKGLQSARDMFTSAIIRDPQYALAYCGLAACYSMIYTFYDVSPSIVENALTACEKALELDPELAEAHAVYGLAMSLDGRYDDAEKEFERAIAIAPKLYDGYYFYARACRAQGKLEKAAEMFEKASETQPEDYQAPVLAGDTYRGLNRPEDMIRAFRRGYEIAERHLEYHPSEARAWYLGAHALHELGENEKALEWNRKAMEIGPRDPATLYNAACLFALNDELDQCFACFERAVEFGFSNRAWLENDPDLAAARDDPRYQALLDKI